MPISTRLVISSTIILLVIGFVASWRARRRGEHARGVALGQAAAAALVATGFLGGHLSAMRKR